MRLQLANVTEMVENQLCNCCISRQVEVERVTVQSKAVRSHEVSVNLEDLYRYTTID